MLLELLVIIVLLGLVAGTVAPAIHAAREDDAERLTRTLSSLLRRSRALAIERNIVVTTIIDPASGRWWLIDDEHHQTVATDSIAIGRTVTLEGGGPRFMLTFEPTGGGTGGELIVRSRERTDVLTTDAWTGETHVVRR